MNTLTQLLKFSCTTLFCGILLLTCTSDDPEADPEITDTLAVEDLDDLSDHLQFLGATKKEGKMPTAPSSSSLQFSIKDTLHLVSGILIPIEFLHDALTDVAGVYIQVHGPLIGGSGGTFAGHYYDVPEVSNTAESDTVSIILVGFDPDDLTDPAGVPPAGSPPFEISIIPYEEDGQPLVKTDVPVIVDDLDDPNGSGPCGLVLPQGDFWDWEQSYIIRPNGTLSFHSAPNVIYGGQEIRGNCCNGKSTYGYCAIGDTTLNASLHFDTYYQIQGETFVFSDDHLFTRRTIEGTAVPVPEESDFCSDAPGVVRDRIDDITYYGNWSLNSMTVPADLKVYYDTRDHLTLQVTNSSGLGYGNPGGIVHMISCQTLVMIQIDREGFGQHLYKYYLRRSPGDPDWYPLT
jgi:hypothetical protein